MILTNSINRIHTILSNTMLSIKRHQKYSKYCSENSIVNIFVFSPAYPKGFSHEKYTVGGSGLFIPIFSDNEITNLYLKLYGNRTDPDGRKISEYHERLMNGDN